MSETLQKYEIMAIIDNSFDEKAAEKYAQDIIVGKIKNLKGNITFEDFWGSRGFAYRINKQTWGYYIVLQFELEKEHLQELKREWTIDQKIVRYLITKIDAKMPAPKKYEDMKQEWVALEKENKIKEIEKTSKPKKTFKKEAPAPVVETPKEAPKPKKEISEKKKAENKDALDKKLDKILEDSSLDL